MQIVRLYILLSGLEYMRNRISIVIVLLIIALGFASCSERQSAEVLSREFEGEVWSRFDYLTASYNVVKAPMTADLVLEIVVSDVYPNIYPHGNADEGVFSISMSINAPDGSRRSRDYRYRLKDSQGNFKAEKVDGYYHYSLPLINEMSFGEAGEYVFKIENKYPIDPLCGFKSLSINCLQIKK